MKQILYIPSGRYFLWFDDEKYRTRVCNLPIISSEECLSRKSDFFNYRNITDITSLLDSIVNRPNIFNKRLYEYAGIDITQQLNISEFEIVEDGK